MIRLSYFLLPSVKADLLLLWFSILVQNVLFVLDVPNGNSNRQRFQMDCDERPERKILKSKD